MWIVLGILVITSILFILFSIRMANVVIYPPIVSLRESMECEYSIPTITLKQYEAIRREPFQLQNKRNELLIGEWLFPEEKSEKTIVICHGFQWNRGGSLKYALLFLKRGWNVLIYDHTRCGESQGRFTTMGYYESEDLIDVLDEVERRFYKGCKIATLGESMGAATVLLHMAKDKRVAFTIADCPYASLENQLTYRLKVQFHLPAFPILPIASWYIHHKVGLYVSEISPMDRIKEAGGVEKIPLLLIHGLEDDYIPYQESERIRDVKKGTVVFYLCKGAKHAKSWITDPAEYDRVVGNFLEEIKEV